MRRRGESSMGLKVCLSGCALLLATSGSIGCGKMAERALAIKNQILPGKPSDPIDAAIYAFNEVKGGGDAGAMCNRAGLVVQALENSEYEEFERISEWSDRRETVCEVARMLDI